MPQMIVYATLHTNNEIFIVGSSITDLLQEATLRLRQNLIIIRLEGQPPLLRRADLRVAEPRLLVRDEGLAMPAAIRRGIDQQLRVAGLIEGEEPERRGIDRLTHLKSRKNDDEKLSGLRNRYVVERGQAVRTRAAQVEEMKGNSSSDGATRMEERE